MRVACGLGSDSVFAAAKIAMAVYSRYDLESLKKGTAKAPRTPRRQEILGVLGALAVPFLRRY
jgi:hypothetical protein